MTGKYLVDVNGAIDLRHYGTVHVEGMMESEARLTVQKCLERFLNAPDIRLEIQRCPNNLCYVITEGSGLADIRRLVTTGHETVLDVLSQVPELKQTSIMEIWIARPPPRGPGCEVVMRVDWKAISQGVKMDTNYCVLPGDRVFITSD